MQLIGNEFLWDLVLVVGAATGIYAALIVLTRMAGLRSFSKISSFDFATTVAMGSIIASTLVATEPLFVHGVVALVSIFGLQYIAAQLRRRMSVQFFDNEPLLLVDENGEFFEENMDAARVTAHDVYAKLREANVHDMSEIRAVVMESTGDISVLHASDPDRRLNPKILTGVRTGEASKPSGATGRP